MSVLLTAEKWGVPPWEVEAARRDERNVWYWRQEAWDEAMSRKQGNLRAVAEAQAKARR